MPLKLTIAPIAQLDLLRPLKVELLLPERVLPNVLNALLDSTRIKVHLKYMVAKYAKAVDTLKQLQLLMQLYAKVVLQAFFFKRTILLQITITYPTVRNVPKRRTLR